MKKKVLVLLFIMLLPNAIFCQWLSNISPYDVQCFTLYKSSIVVGTNMSGIFISSDNGNTWQVKNIGLPSPCSIKSILASGDLLFAGTDHGVFLFEDNGNKWKAKNIGLPDICSVESIITVGNLLFAGTDNGVFISRDNGNSWQAKSNGLTTILVTSLSYNGSNLFTGTNGGGMFMSDNNGDSWLSINNEISNLHISSIALDSNIIFVGTENGMFSSTNNGANWNSINNGIMNPKIKEIDINGNNIFILAGDSIYLSTDNGANWILRNDPIWNFQLEYNIDICAVGISGDRVFVFREDSKIYRSEDNGTNWVALNLSGSIIEILSCEGNLIYVGTNSDGIYLSKDDGISWKSVNNGIDLEVYNIRDIAIDGSNVFLTTPEGIFFSMNEGEHWEKVSDFFADKITISGNNVYAGRQDILLSTDYGKTWNPVTNNLPHSFIMSLVSDGNNIYAGIDQYSRGLYLSTDSGKYWVNRFSGSEVLDVEIDGNNMYIGTWLDGIYRSINNGDLWEQINSGLPDLHNNSIEKRGDILVADGYISTDNGNNWKSLFGAGDVVDVGITEDFIFSATYESVKRLPLPVLLISRSSISFYDPNNPGSATFDITSTTDWTITKSKDWLTCSEYSGSGHATITVSTTINPSSIPRVDTLSVSGIGAIPQKMLVRHYGQYLEVTDDTLVLEAMANNSQTFDIYSSFDWTITCNQSWLTISNSVGTGDATIILTATENPTIAVRIATLTVSGIGFDDQIITVIQYGGTTGISDLTNEYSIYPNPSSSILYLNINNEVVRVTVIDINGKIMLNNKIINNQINISSLQNGVYTVKIETETKILFRKFIKL